MDRLTATAYLTSSIKASAELPDRITATARIVNVVIDSTGDNMIRVLVPLQDGVYDYTIPEIDGKEIEDAQYEEFNMVPDTHYTHTGNDQLSLIPAAFETIKAIHFCKLLVK